MQSMRMRRRMESGIPIGDLPVGSIVKLSVNGSLIDFLVVNQGIPSNSSLYASSCNGSWLLMKCTYEDRQWHTSNSNKYADSSIRKYLENTFITLLDSKVSNNIVSVKIPYVVGGGSTTKMTGESGLESKVFLLSGYEGGLYAKWNGYSQDITEDGAVLEYFLVGDGSQQNDKRKTTTLSGGSTSWRTRSPVKGTSDSAWGFNGSGRYRKDTCTTSLGFRPAFVMPFDFEVKDNGNGTYIVA